MYKENKNIKVIDEIKSSRLFLLPLSGATASQDSRSLYNRGEAF
jgi:hypothetical protein